MTNRKFADEFGLSLVVTPAYFGRQREIATVEVPSEPACHLYIVSQHSRLSIAPSSAGFVESNFSVTLRMQDGGGFQEFPVTFPFTTEDNVRLRLESEWPHEEIRFIEEDTAELFFTAPVALFVRSFAPSAWPEVALNQEILYVGQAFGKEGERTAYDRLKSHSTLQRIYAEIQPDKEVWLSLCAISDVVLLQSMTPPKSR